MTIKKYNKLVRDKIPEIIYNTGSKPKVYIANEIEYSEHLKKKLQEEGKLKDPKCRHVNTKGERCSVSVANAGDLCTIHEEVLQRTDGKKTRCKQVKADGKRCGMQTSNKSGYCYYHD